MQLRIAISLISAGAIAYEILLIRIFSIIQWHHFAAMVISLALLGYGVSGTLLTLGRSWLNERSGSGDPAQPAETGRQEASLSGPRWRLVFILAASLFGVLAVLCLVLAQRIPFNPLALIWEYRQTGHLATLYLLLSVPFVCAASCIGVGLMAGGRGIPGIYRADLLGAGAGAAGIVVAMSTMSLATCAKGVAAMGFLAAAVLSAGGRRRRRQWAPALLLAAGTIALVLWPDAWLRLRLSEFKALSKTLLVPETEVVAERSSPLGLLTVVDSPTIPFRHAPGLSLGYGGRLAEQLGVFTDGDSMTVINRFTGQTEDVDYLDYLPSALPYHLLDRPSVLVLGPGGGSEVVAALTHGARRIEAVEYNRQMSALLLDDFTRFSGDLYRRPTVHLVNAEGRSYLRRTRRRYDLVQMSLVDSLAATTGGTQAVNASYLYTVEAVLDMLDRLQPDGLLVLTRWLQIPPRGNLKLFATAVEALQRLEVSNPGRHLAQVRGWGTVTTLVKRSGLVPDEIAAIREFCEQRSFDLAFHSGMRIDDANRYNQLDAPYLYSGAVELLSDSEAFYDSYKFEIRPATDDRPFFFHFFKWRVLPELLGLRSRAGTPMVEWGYLILVATVVQAALAGALLILLPLRLVAKPGSRKGSGRVLAYFAALGLAFLLLEIAFIQRLTLYLGHPIYAVAIVLAGFLVFAGLGSGYSQRHRLGGRQFPAGRAISLVIGLGLLYVVALPLLFRSTIAMPDVVKISLTLLWMAPLAFFMGMPFPLGLLRAMEVRPVWVPWAWGINGCASVVGAAMAPLVAIHLGFTAVVFAALACYGLCGWILRFAPFAASGGVDC